MDEIAGLVFGATLAACITVFVTVELYHVVKAATAAIREMEERKWR